jgi:hypothetical protein
MDIRYMKHIHSFIYQSLSRKRAALAETSSENVAISVDSDETR